MIALTSELVLLAACCRWPRSDERNRAVTEAAKGIDWPRFLATVHKHRVEALAYDGLKQADVDLPGEVQEQLSARANSAAMAALAMARETVRLQRALDERTIPNITVKGVSLGLIAYGDIGLKQSLDIDLLTTPAHAAAACEILEAMGYRMIVPDGVHDQRLEGASFQRFARTLKDITFHNPATGIRIELHWRLFDNRRLLPGIDAASPTQKVMLGGEALRTLADAPLFAYLAAHGTLSGWARMKWPADINAFLSARDEAGKAALYRSAVEQGADRTARVAFALCAQLFGATIPADAAKDIERDPVAREMAETALASLSHGGGTEDYATYSSQWWAVQRDRMRLMPGAGYALAELRQFSASPVDRANIALPGPLRFIYLLLRLPLWGLRVVKRRFSGGSAP